MAKVSETLSVAGGNFARPTKFNVLLAPPTELVTTEQKSFDVLCKDVQIPEITMVPIDINIKGHQVRIPGRVNQDQNITMTFLLDEYHILRKTFTDWIAALDPRYYGARSEQGKALYEADNKFGNMIIATRDFNESMNQPMNYFFEGVYPISVSGPNFGSANTNEVIEISVTFAYFRFLQKDDMADKYDDLDELLEEFGIPAVAGLSSFAPLRTALGAAKGIIGNVSSVANTLSNFRL